MPKFEVTLHGLEGILGFIFLTLQKQQKSLLVKVLFIVLDFLFIDVLVELSEFLFLIVIVLNLSEVKEATSLFAFFCLFFLFYLNPYILFGKNK